MVNADGIPTNDFLHGGFLTAAEEKSNKKRIIICCDGTWQSSASTTANVASNVTRLARSLSRAGEDANGQVWQQIVHYDSGVGTNVGFLETVGQGVSGRGLDINVIEAYNFIVNNFRPGDKIYCFGFSRGAYTARAVAGLVTDIGVMKREDMDQFPALYGEYRKNVSGGDFRATPEFQRWIRGVPTETQQEHGRKTYKWGEEPHTLPPNSTRFVEVVGVFDTVGSLGIPDGTIVKTNWTNLSFTRKAQGFHNVKLSPYIKHAYHALALDEHRKPFFPTLWYIPEKETYEEIGKSAKDILIEYEKETSPEKKSELWEKYLYASDAEQAPKFKESDLSQVWFPGVHINIGGGSDSLLKTKSGDLEQIAWISFAWMVDQCRPYLTFDEGVIDSLRKSHQNRVYSIRYEKNFGTGHMNSKMWKTLDDWNIYQAPTFTVPEEVTDGWAVGPIIDSLSGAMRLGGSLRRIPGDTIDENKKRLRDLGKTNEFIHPCVYYRQQHFEKTATKYENEFLENFERKSRQTEDGSRRWEWVHKAEPKFSVAEYVIPPTTPTLPKRTERDVVHDDEAKTFLKQLDAEYGFQAVNGH